MCRGCALCGRDCGSSGGRLSGPAHSRSPCPSHHHALGGKESEPTSDLDHLPTTLMDQPMVVKAEQDLVGDVVRTAVAPELDVMRGRPAGGAVAAGEAAAAISHP